VSKRAEAPIAVSREEPRPAPPPAQPEQQTIEKPPEPSGQRAPDFGVSGTKFRLVKSEWIEPEEDETESQKSPFSDDYGWVWNGKDWSVTETPGSSYTRKFVLRLKDMEGKYHYARSCSLNLEEYNRRFAGRRGVADRRLKPVRKSHYDKFKTFVFEAWRSEALRTHSTRLGHAAGLV
jgi:hypothetical protein